MLALGFSLRVFCSLLATILVRFYPALPDQGEGLLETYRQTKNKKENMKTDKEIIASMAAELGISPEEAETLFQCSPPKAAEQIEEIFSSKVSPFETPTITGDELVETSKSFVDWVNQNEPNPDVLAMAFNLIDQVCYNLGFRYYAGEDKYTAQARLALSVTIDRESTFTGRVSTLEMAKSCYDLAIQAATWLANQGWNGGQLAAVLEAVLNAVELSEREAHEILEAPRYQDEDEFFGYDEDLGFDGIF